MNGYLMNQNRIAGEIIDGKIIAVHENLLPLFFKENNDVYTWIKSRAIDSDRINSRLIKKALSLNKDDLTSVLSVHAASNTDSYWIKLENEQITYEDVNFKSDSLSDLALLGNLDIYSHAALLQKSRQTPELTNIGSFEKGWKLKDNTWWLVKTGTPEQFFSEIFCYKLGKYLGFNMAEYHLAENFIWSRDFTEQKKNFEPAMSLIGDQTENYSLNYLMFKNISKNCAEDYLNILYLDAITRNPDRHEYNYGILRDQETGEIIGLAPNFDNNLALISTGYPTYLNRKDDLMIKNFTKFLEECTIEYSPPQFDELDIVNIIDSIDVSINKKIICEFVLNGQDSFLERALQGSKEAEDQGWEL